MDNTTEICYICFNDDEETSLLSKLISPCNCINLKAHRECLEKWRQLTTNREMTERCGVCNSPYNYEFQVENFSLVKVFSFVFLIIRDIIYLSFILLSIIIFVFLCFDFNRVYIFLSYYFTSFDHEVMNKFNPIITNAIVVLGYITVLICVHIILTKIKKTLNENEFCKLHLLNIYLVPFTASNVFEYDFPAKKLCTIRFMRSVGRQLSDGEFCTLCLFLSLFILLEFCIAYPYHILRIYLKNLYYLNPLKIYQLKDMHPVFQKVNTKEVNTNTKEVNTNIKEVNTNPILMV